MDGGRPIHADALPQFLGVVLGLLPQAAQPGFREWLNRTCHNAGFTPRVLQDAELETALMTFVAEGLGVTLTREHIKKLPHPGVTLRLLTPTLKSDYGIAWNRTNDSRALRQYIEVVKGMTRRSD